MKNLSIILISVFLFNCSGAVVGNIISTEDAQGKSKAYRLMAGDKVELQVTQRPDISGEYTLDPDGSLSLQLIGNVTLRGLTRQEAQDTLQNKLEEYYSPISVVLKLKSYQSSEFFVVMGEVRAAGVYPLKDRISVLKALGMAQGCTPEAAISRIQLIRNSPGQQVLKINLKEILNDADFSQDYILKKDDMIFVPRKKLWNVMLSLNQIMPTMQFGLLTFLTFAN